MNEINLLTYRRIVARHHRAAQARRTRRYLSLADAYEQATGQTVWTVAEVVAWGADRGLLTTTQVLADAIEDALHGRPAMLQRLARTPELPFLLHPARLVRAIEAALMDECEDDALLEAVARRWRELAEAPADAPFPWTPRLVLTVAGAVRRAEL